MSATARSTEPWTHEFAFAVSGSPARVFAALTDPSQLRAWFAEHVEIDPRAGGTIRFWGRHTYGAPDRPLVASTIRRFEPGETLVFEWGLEGVAGEATIELRPDEKTADGSRTAVAVRHSFERRIPIAYGDELVDDLWRLTLGNLDAHLRGGTGIVLPDFTQPTAEIRLSIVIDAPRARVFRALVDPDALNRWIATSASVDPRTGGTYSFAWKYEHKGRRVESGPTTILDLVENERLVIDWTDWRGDTTRPPTRVAWVLGDEGHGTRVTLVHSGFSRVADQSDYPFGWGWFLDRLRAEAEARPVAPMSPC
jgi:uncharacterized protein YndB with AHSA1/START domain